MNTIITDFAPPSILHLRDASADKEADFETVAIRILRSLYPNCTVFAFRPVVSFGDANWQPDLALVDKTHRYWFVVEVETVNHHLEKHVIPQALAFTEGRYGDDAINIVGKELGLRQAEAATFLSFIPRYVAVVSNHSDNSWTKKLESVNVQHVTISSFHDPSTNQTAHSVHGVLVPAEESLGFGLVRATDRAVVTKVQDHWADGDYKVLGPRGSNIWSCTRAGKQVWLMKKAGLIEFADDSIVQIIRRDDGNLLFRLPYSV